MRCNLMAVPGEAACKSAFLEMCHLRYKPRYGALADSGYLLLSGVHVRCVERTYRAQGRSR